MKGQLFLRRSPPLRTSSTRTVQAMYFPQTPVWICDLLSGSTRTLAAISRVSTTDCLYGKYSFIVGCYVLLRHWMYMKNIPSERGSGGVLLLGSRVAYTCGNLKKKWASFPPGNHKSNKSNLGFGLSRLYFLFNSLTSACTEKVLSMKDTCVTLGGSSNGNCLTYIVVSSVRLSHTKRCHDLLSLAQRAGSIREYWNHTSWPPTSTHLLVTQYRN